MAGAFINVEVDATPVLDALERLVALGRDLRPALGDIADEIWESTRTRIEGGGPAPDGAPWAPLSPVTRARKTRLKDHILMESGDLLGSIHPEIGRDYALVGTDQPYAAALQFGMDKGYAGTTSRGAPIPWGDIPARPFLGLSAEDEDAVLDILARHIEAAI